MNQELWDETVRKHGHTCAGVAYGYRIGCEVMKIFSPEEPLHCITSLDNCVTDGVAITTGVSIKKGSLSFDPTVDGFIFYNTEEEEGWHFSLKKLEYSEEADPVFLILAVNRDKLFEITPCDIDVDMA